MYMYPTVPEVLFLVVGLQLCMMCTDMYMKCVVNLATQSARRIAYDVSSKCCAIKQM